MSAKPISLVSIEEDIDQGQERYENDNVTLTYNYAKLDCSNDQSIDTSTHDAI